MSARRLTYTADLTPEEWQILEPLLPPEKAGGRARKYPLREVMNGIQYVLRGGGAWRMMPHDLPHWQTAYQCCRTWQQDDVAPHLGSAARRGPHAHGRQPQPSAPVIDAQTVQTTEKGGPRLR